MNLRSIDLNLLVILHVLLEEAHVTRASERLGLSQPAMSNALKRCRSLFGDPLLKRGRGGMRLTPKAESLQGPLQQALAGVEGLFARSEPSLFEVEQTVRIAVSGIPVSLLAAPLWSRLAKTAPGISLVMHPWQGAMETFEALGRGEVDAVVSVAAAMDESFHRVELLQEHFVVAMRRGHPASLRFSLEQWLAYPHVLVSSHMVQRGSLDRKLAELGLSRRVGIVVPDFGSVFPLLSDSELIAMVPSRSVPADALSRCSLRKPPIPIDGFGLQLFWHMRREDDQVLRHVVGLLQEVCRVL